MCSLLTKSGVFTVNQPVFDEKRSFRRDPPLPSKSVPCVNREVLSGPFSTTRTIQGMPGTRNPERPTTRPLASNSQQKEVRPPTVMHHRHPASYLDVPPSPHTCGSLTICGVCRPCLSCCPPPKINDMRPPPRSPLSCCRDSPPPSPEPAPPVLSPYLACWRPPPPLPSLEFPALLSGSPPHGCCPIPRLPGPNPAPPRPGLIFPMALPPAFRNGGERMPEGV